MPTIYTTPTATGTGELPPEQLLAVFEREKQKLDKALPVIPQLPDKEQANHLLLRIRNL